MVQVEFFCGLAVKSTDDQFAGAIFARFAKVADHIDFPVESINTGEGAILSKGLKNTCLKGVSVDLLNVVIENICQIEITGRI